MQADHLPSRKSSKKPSSGFKLFLTFLITIFLTGSVLLLYFVFGLETANDEQVHPYPEAQAHEELGTFYPLIYEGELQAQQVLMQGGEYYVPFDVLKTYVDSSLHYDEQEQILILTTTDKVISLKNRLLTDEIKGETTELQFPIIEHEGEIYVPYSPFSEVYSYAFKLHEEMQVVELKGNNHVAVQGQIYSPQKKEGAEPKPVYVRTEPAITSPYVQTLYHDDFVELYSEDNAWYYIQTEAGALGYISKESMKFTGVVQLPDTEQAQEEESASAPKLWRPKGSKINLTWEHVVSRNPNTEQIGPMPGVNVVSPTWFHFKEADGSLKNLADKSYVDWAHERGYQVWAIITNDFDPDLTHDILSSYEKRRNVILQLVYFSELYDLQGINIDFENVYLKDKENLVQFVREMTPYMHDLGLVVSIDVTIKSTSEMWSMFLDRPALGQVVDYMMVMTYDEHWGSSPVAGSVASLPWVEKGLQGILEEVPHDKVVLGVPFYTRLWKEAKGEDGQIKVSSKAYSMNGIEKWMEERGVTTVFDETTGQHYAEYKDQTEDAMYKIWLEDEKSMEQRIELVHKYNLAGVASWRRGFEKPVIWDVINQTLNTR